MSKKILIPLLLWLIAVGVYHLYKPLPEDLQYVSAVELVAANDVHFFRDTTYIDAAGVRQSEQHIFDEIFRMIAESEQYVLIDMFLFNDLLGAATTSYRQISKELTDALVAKKQTSSSTIVQVITDPINTIYGGVESTQLDALAAAGVTVVLTDLTQLRDSNPLYTALWRTFGQWWGNSTDPGYLPNPFASQGQKLGVRTYLRLLNFKANHRKVVLTDYNQNGDSGFSTLVTSANPHDGSSAHSNVAIRVDNALWRDVLKTESAVAELSGATLVQPTHMSVMPVTAATENTLQVQLLTEEAIKQRILSEINVLEAGDSLDIAMFYLAERDVVYALRQADQRGATLRLLLDPNKDAFGREKGGVPNRQVAHELMSESSGNTTVRWCYTTGEQCHSKMLMFSSGATTTLIQGSANLTRRNINGFNLETNLVIVGDSATRSLTEARQFFNQQWNNQESRLASVAYSEYADTSYLKTLRYRIMELTGLSSW
jgi:HKD family nuclease